MKKILLLLMFVFYNKLLLSGPVSDHEHYNKIDDLLNLKRADLEYKKELAGFVYTFYDDNNSFTSIRALNRLIELHGGESPEVIQILKNKLYNSDALVAPYVVYAIHLLKPEDSIFKKYGKDLDKILKNGKAIYSGSTHEFVSLTTKRGNEYKFQLEVASNIYHSGVSVNLTCLKILRELKPKETRVLLRAFDKIIDAISDNVENPQFSPHLLTDYFSELYILSENKEPLLLTHIRSFLNILNIEINHFAKTVLDKIENKAYRNNVIKKDQNRVREIQWGKKTVPQTLLGNKHDELIKAERTDLPYQLELAKIVYSTETKRFNNKALRKLAKLKPYKAEVFIELFETLTRTPGIAQKRKIAEFIMRNAPLFNATLIHNIAAYSEEYNLNAKNLKLIKKMLDRLVLCDKAAQSIGSELLKEVN